MAGTLLDELAKRDARSAALEQQLADLSTHSAEIERAGKRQATPFARRKHVAQPRKPGRKEGKGRFAHRARPTPAQVQATKEAPLADSPACHGPLTKHKDHEQFVVDIPLIEPEITRYVTPSGYCAQCRRRVRSRHSEQIPQMRNGKDPSSQEKPDAIIRYAKYGAYLPPALGGNPPLMKPGE